MFLNSIKLRNPLDNNSYLNNVPAVNYLVQNEELVFMNPITFFMGENGTGKSTLIEAIAVGLRLPAEGGSAQWTYSYEDSHSELYKHISLLRGSLYEGAFFLRAESFYTMTHFMIEEEIGTWSDKSNYVSESHGESFLDIAMNRFTENGLYILDEPESALSPQRQIEFMKRIDDLVHQNCQFIIATHSPLLTCIPNSEVWEFSNVGIMINHYTQTEHFMTLKRFYQQPEEFVHNHFVQNS